MENETDALGKRLDPDNYFAIVGRRWDARQGDHVDPIPDPEGARRFRDVADALNRYHTLTYENFKSGDGQDIRMELVHVRFGIPHALKSRILFP